jgi:hypothetical protein
MMRVPKGFEDVDDRNRFASRLKGMVDAYEASVGSDLAPMEKAAGAYESTLTLSSLEFIEDAVPYNVPLIEIRVDGIVESTCGAFAASDPLFICKGGGDDEDRDACEHDLHFAYEQAGFDVTARQIGLQAAIWTRGPFKQEFEVTREDELSDSQSSQAGPIRSAGLKHTPIPAKQFIWYPKYADDPQDCVMVGEWSMVEAGTIRELIAVVNSKEEAGHKIYTTLVKVRPGGHEIDHYTDGEKIPKRRWYQVVWNYNLARILWIEEYDDPTLHYFAPTFQKYPQQFWGTNSPATRLLELQAVVNDAFFLGIIGTAESAFKKVLIGNYTGDAQTINTGLGKWMGFKGNPTFHTVEGNFQPGGIGAILSNAERYADGSAGSSGIDQGQELEGKKTAAEANGLLQAGMRGRMAQATMFAPELVRAASHAQYLLAKNWADWKKANKDFIQAKSKKAYQRRYGIEVNGKTPNNNPEVAIDKLNTLVKVAKILQIEMPPVLDKQIDGAALFDLVLNALDLHVSIGKVVKDLNTEQPINDEPPILDPTSVLGQNAAYEPSPDERAAVLANLYAGGGAAPMDPLMGGEPPMLPYSGALDPGLLLPEGLA